MTHVRTLTLLTSLAGLCSPGCGAAPPRPELGAVSPSDAVPGPVTTWYEGTTSVSSADGATPYGPPKPAVVARTVDVARGRIVEVVVDEGALRTTTLDRVGETSVFSATDQERSFTGTVTMAGDDWNITGWTYALSMSDGSGRIEGTATLDATGLKTEKYFVGPDGQRRVRIVDALAPVTREVYERDLAAALAKPR